MLRKLLMLSVIGFSTIVTGCAVANHPYPGYGGQPTGVIYSGYNSPGNVANPQVQPLKSGQACSYGILWAAAWGDAGTDDAAKAGGISKIANVQYSNLSVLSGVFSKYCTIVTGE